MVLAAKNSDNLDQLFFHIWYEYFMNIDKDTVKQAYHKTKEKENSKVDADVLRELGYTEEDIQNAIFD